MCWNSELFFVGARGQGRRVGMKKSVLRSTSDNIDFLRRPLIYWSLGGQPIHYNDVIMSAMASQITNLSIVCSTVGPGADQRMHQSSASLAFVRGIYRNIVNWALRNKLHWNCQQNSCIFIPEYLFGNVWKLRPLCPCLNVLNETYFNKEIS